MLMGIGFDTIHISCPGFSKSKYKFKETPEDIEAALIAFKRAVTSLQASNSKHKKVTTNLTSRQFTLMHTMKDHNAYI